MTENVYRQSEVIESTLATLGKFTAEGFRTSRLPILNLPTDVLEVLRQGRIEYTKARAIARVKDEGDRAGLLKRAVEENLSLTQINKLIQQLKPSPPNPDRDSLNTKYSELGNRLKSSLVWEDAEKVERLQTLLHELEQLI